MAEINLKSLKFPGSDNTYTIPQTAEDIGALPITGGTITGDIHIAAINELETADISFARPSGCEHETHIDALQDALRVYTWDKNNAYSIKASLKLSDGSFSSYHIRPYNPVEVAYGGTGATDPATARANLGAFGDLGGTTNADLNTLTTPGVYRFHVEAANLGNCHLPIDITVAGLITWVNLIVIGEATRCTQILSLPFSHHYAMHVRYKHDSNWSEWYPILTPYISGFPIYEMKINIGALPASTTKTIYHGVANNRIVDFYIIGIGDTSGFCRVFPTTASPSDYVSVWNKDGYLNIKANEGWSEYNNCWAFIKYTPGAWY